MISLLFMVIPPSAEPRPAIKAAFLLGFDVLLSDLGRVCGWGEYVADGGAGRTGLLLVSFVRLK